MRPVVTDIRQNEREPFFRGIRPHSRSSSNAGFTLIISVLISSILLSIGLAMFNISLKEATLSSLGKESQVSYYAADSAIECVYYWDLPPVLVGFFDAQISTGDMQCNNGNVIVNSSNCAAGICEHNLTYNLGGSADECAEIYIRKDSVALATTIEARGYNTCDTNNPRRTERGIKIE